MVSRRKAVAAAAAVEITQINIVTQTYKMDLVHASEECR